LIAIVVCAVFTGAAAQKKRRGKRGKKSRVPTSAQISPALGDLKWGMGEKDLLKVLIGKVKERYRPLIAKTTDGIEDDRLRTREQADIAKIRESFVRFDGKSTGWDLGYLKDEFSHNNGESMYVVKDSNSQNFYFFINNRLWKWYKAFDIEEFEGKSFDEFSAAAQRKFGKAKDVTGELVKGAEKRRWLEWQDKTTRLRAIDQTAFFGFYCLVFEEKKTVNRLGSLRTNVPRRKKASHTMIDAVTSDKDMAAHPDESPDIVDRITGKIRVRRDKEDDRGKDRRRRSYGSDDYRPSSADDPLKGL
jgi:hypothetical protein